MSTMDILKDFAEAVKATGGQTTKPYDTPATVIRVEGDIVWVHIPGGVDETPVQLTIAAKPGDTVQLRVSGGSAWIVGNATAPPTDDTTARSAKEVAESAKRIAQDNVKRLINVVRDLGIVDRAVTEARQIADATKQHFWTDDNGAHVSTVADAPASGNNLLMNALGILLRSGSNILAQFSASQVAFYDGDGNDEENVVAAFGKEGAQVGYSSSGHLNLASNSITAVSDIGAKLFSVGTNRATEQIQITKDIGAAIKVTSMSSSSPDYLVVALPITDEVTGGAFRVDYEWYGNSGSNTFRYKGTFDGVIGTTKSEDVHADRIGMHLNYSVVTISGEQRQQFSVNAYKTSVYNTYVRVISVTYDGYTAMPTYDLGTRALADNFAGSFSTVIGESLFATGDRQTALGRFNVEDTNDEYALIIGNGTDDQNRSNALTVDWTGKLSAAGGYDGLVAVEDVPLTVSFAAGTIGTRAESLSAGSIVKSGYTYIGAYVADHRNTSYFSATIVHNGPNNTAHLIVNRATGNAVTDAEVTVRKIWLKTGA